jgi:integrase
VIYWDTLLPAFGLRVAASGRKTWLTMYRVNGKLVQETLGTYALNPSVAEARDRARASMAMASHGEHPVAARRERQVKARTFSQAVDRYKAEYLEPNCRPGTVKEAYRILTRDVPWGALPLREITRQQIHGALEAKASTRKHPRKGSEGGAIIQSNRVLARLRAFFGWARALDLIDTDPTQGIRKLAKETSRDRVLTDEELVTFWNACDQLGWPNGQLFQFLCLTAQRRDEVGEMRWVEIDLEKRVWTIPRERSKNGRAHEVNLSEFAVGILQALPRLAGPYVFSTMGDRPVNSYGSAKARLDSLRGDTPAWRLHDLRRTATSGMARLNIPPHIVDKILNHTAGTIKGVAAVYNRFEYADERKAALEAWSRYVEALVHPERTSNVVEFVR